MSSKGTQSESPMAKPLPMSPKMNKLRQEVAKKSPVRSPLREVLKKRCAERMKNKRDQVVAGFRGREFIEHGIQSMIKDELDELRGRGRGRRTLTFGFTDYEVDLALQEIEDIEVELLEIAEILSEDDLSTVCPICLKNPLQENISSVGITTISCSKQCGNLTVMKGSLKDLSASIDHQTDQHSKDCDNCLSFSLVETNCILTFCDVCDFCSTIP